MSDFVILTDSSADLTPALVEKLELEVLPMSFVMDDKSYQNFPDNHDMDPHEFYEKLRAGSSATTAAINVHEYTESLEKLLKAGKDVLLMVFSSGLSSTYQSSVLAVEELREEYPDRKLYTVDTLSASMGQGLLVCLASDLRSQGKSIEEVRDWVEANKLKLCHQFTVDDLFFLKRGGRISATTAAVGSMLKIKPVLHVDDEGKLVSISKARGRAASLRALVDKMEQTAIEPEKQTVFISHGDCPEDAQMVADLVKERMGVQKVVINHIGPVIGAHSGPGTVALFYVGTER